MKIIRADEQGYSTGRYLDDGSGRSVNVVNFKNRIWENSHRRTWQAHMCCMGDHGSRVSIVFSVWCLINDYHSIMDAWPRHENWSGVY